MRLTSGEPSPPVPLSPHVKLSLPGLEGLKSTLWRGLLSISSTSLTSLELMVAYTARLISSYFYLDSKISLVVAVQGQTEETYLPKK
jgi:hypothetical protein